MTTQNSGYRLPRGGIIDRSRTLSFAFNGRRFSGHPGDSLASALMANGVSLIARSFKYHRPRGFYGAGLEDPNSMLAVKDAYGFDAAIRAGQVRLEEGIEAHSVTGAPSVHFDVGAVAQLASWLLSAGFYYKTFMWPNWSFFEPAVRRATGFGRPKADSDTRQVEHRFASCDVLIIGGGAAGLKTARALRGSGLEVTIADEQHTIGGSLLWEATEVDGLPGVDFARKLVSEIGSDEAFTLLPSTLVTGAYENNVFTLVQGLHDSRGLRGERHWKLRASHVVLATGMVDRPLLFDGNDRPGIMLSSSVRRLIGEFAVAPARRLAVYTNNDSGYLTAINACLAGMDVVAIIDTRPVTAAIHGDQAQQLGIVCHFDSQIETTYGYRRLRGLAVRGAGGNTRRIVCDGLATSGGWTPLIHLAAHRGIKPEYDPGLGAFVCPRLPAGWVAVGGVTGTPDLGDVFRAAVGVAQSIAATFASAGAAGTEARQGATIAVRDKDHALALRVKAPSFGTVTPLWLPSCGSSKKTWVDLQNDVKLSDIELAIQENYTSVEHLKRYTTLGMGTDQGRTSNTNGLGVLAALTGQEMGAVGTTTFRPPYAAVRMATIANGRRGDAYRPRRYLPADAVHRELGAVMEDFGWERPDWYRSNGKEREQAISVEMRAVRENVGVFDSSTLGKIEITGPDAARFLAKFYVSDMTTLTPGRVRYSVMLREDGVIFDDGVVACIAPNHFLASPTSGNAEAVAAWFERWRQTEWPTMQVAISPVTANWAAIAIAGPKARDLLGRLAPSFDISPAAFPHMAFREGTIAGTRARIGRISFTGELQYEVSVPSRYAVALMRMLMAEGPGTVARPVGMEAWLRLRLEKGYLHLGSDTNGRTTPLDVGLGSVVTKRTDDFIGRRSLRLPSAMSPEREQLVGLTALNGTLQVGGRIMAPGHARIPCQTEGYVTSACYSPTVGKSIGLALLKQGRDRKGETVSVYTAGRIVRGCVCDPIFYDTSGDRLHA